MAVVENDRYDEKVSIIVPIYNAEKYIRILISSILAQTCGNFELLLIDDGSIDLSYSICKEYESKDDRIRVFKKPNGGANSARLLGLNVSANNYILFVDADDEIANDSIESLTHLARCYSDADIIAAHNSCSQRLVDGPEYLMDIISGHCHASMCTKLYKRTLLEESFCALPMELTMGEDYIQNINIALSVSKVLYTDLEFYIYRETPVSVSRTFVRSQDYESMFHKEVDKILYGSSVFEHMMKDQKENIIFSWNRSRLNGYIQAVLYSCEFDFGIKDFVDLKSALKPSLSYLGIDERIMLNVTNYRLCNLMLRCYYKVLHTLERVNKRVNLWL